MNLIGFILLGLITGFLVSRVDPLKVEGGDYLDLLFGLSGSLFGGFISFIMLGLPLAGKVSFVSLSLALLMTLIFLFISRALGYEDRTEFNKRLHI